jgi:hypothetical protein
MSAYDDIIRAALIKMRDAGMTRAEAAREIGVSYNSFIARINRIGLDWPRAFHAWDQVVTSERNAQILVRHENGELHTSIAADYGLSRERVRQIVKSQGGKARFGQRREAFATIIEAVKNLPPMSLSEACNELGFGKFTVAAAAKSAGVKFLRRDSETTAMLAGLAEKVKAGASFNAAAEGNHELASLLGRYCIENGIKSQAPCRWTVDPEMRRRVIAEMRAEGRTWDSIAGAIATNEGVRKMGDVTVRAWCEKHAPDLLNIKPPKKVKPPKRAYRAAQQRTKPAPVDARVLIVGDVRETAIANYGKAPASKIAQAVGVTRNSIIGHWFRARKTGEIAA